MRVLLVHQFFLGPGDPGGSRWNEFAKYWAAKGHEITVIAGNIHYATGRRYPDCRGRYVTRQQERPGVTVLRCHVSRTYASGSRLGRAWALVTFMVSSILAGILRAPRPDVIVATSPPLGVTLTMWALSAWHKAPAVFEVRDLWPDCLVAEGLLRNRLALRLFYWMEAVGYRRSRWVNVLTPAFERWIADRKGVPRARMSMIPNGADLDLLEPGPKENAVRRKLGLEGKFVVSYFGAHGRANALDQLLDTAALVKDEMPDVRFMLVGDGPVKGDLVARAGREGLTNVVFADAVAKAEVADYINASDVCTATLLNIEHYKMYYPNKVFDYMCCARPIIIAIDGVARELVEKAGAGLFAEPENPRAFREALGAMRRDPEAARRMGESGRCFVAENFSRRMLAERLLEIVTSVAEGRRAS